MTLPIPGCFADLSSKDANLEMMVANTIQPMKLPYVANVVKRAIGIIFNNYDKKDALYDHQAQRTKTAEKLLEGELDCEDVHEFTGLSKGQIVEKMDLFQCEADEFEANNTDEHAILAFVIVHIGLYWPSETDAQFKTRTESESLVKPKMMIAKVASVMNFITPIFLLCPLEIIFDQIICKHSAEWVCIF